MIEMSTGVDWLVLNAVSCRRVRIPLHTAQVIECDLANEMSDFINEPVNVFPEGVVDSRTYSASGNKGKLCVMNMTDILLKQEVLSKKQQQLVQSRTVRLQCVGSQ